MAKQDFLRECMNDVGQMPIDAFNTAYCVRCANRECGRSGLSATSFDRRVNNWQDDMFTNVQRASEDDPRFVNIRTKHFKTIDAPLIVSSAAKQPVFKTVDVVTAPEPAISVPDPVISEMESTNTSSARTTVKEPMLVPETSHDAVVKPMEIPVSISKHQSHNTPFAQGTMLPGHEEKPDDLGDIEIGSGGTFTFGESDE